MTNISEKITVFLTYKNAHDKMIDNISDSVYSLEQAITEIKLDNELLRELKLIFPRTVQDHYPAIISYLHEATKDNRQALFRFRYCLVHDRKIREYSFNEFMHYIDTVKKEMNNYHDEKTMGSETINNESDEDENDR